MAIALPGGGNKRKNASVQAGVHYCAPQNNKTCISPTGVTKAMSAELLMRTLAASEAIIVMWSVSLTKEVSNPASHPRDISTAPAMVTENNPRTFNTPSRKVSPH